MRAWSVLGSGGLNGGICFWGGLWMGDIVCWDRDMMGLGGMNSSVDICSVLSVSRVYYFFFCTKLHTFPI